MRNARTHLYASWAALAVVAAACATELPTSAVPPLTITPVSWADTLMVGDDTTLTVAITNPSGANITGISIAWQSGNDSVIQIVPDSTNTPQRDRGVRIHVRALAAGSATISNAPVTIGGQVEPGNAFSMSVAVHERWQTIGAGEGVTCALNMRGEAYCWGADSSLGNGTSTNALAPELVLNPTSFRFSGITAGGAGACASVSEGSWYCWGTNTEGQLGDGFLANAFVPILLQSNRLLTSVSIGNDHGCGVSANQVAVCWGYDQQGQLGNGEIDTTATDGSNPVGHPSGTGCPVVTAFTVYCVDNEGVAPAPLPLASVSAGGSHSCGLSPQGLAYCWGLNDLAQAGTPPGGPLCDFQARVDAQACDSVATAVSGGKTYLSISAGWTHSCALGTDHSIYCWGENSFGALGAVTSEICTTSDGSTSCSSTPIAPSTPTTFQTVGAGLQFTCGLASDGSVYCWGLNLDGELGDGTTTTRFAPVQTIGGLHFASISVGYDHVCGLTSRGEAYCWGSNSSGQLGTGDTADKLQPTRVVEHASQFAAGATPATTHGRAAVLQQRSRIP